MYSEMIMKYLNANTMQILIDVVLCMTTVFALWRMTKAKTQPVMDKSMLIELQQVISGSHAATKSYLDALNESRKSAKEVAFLLADREKRAKELLDKIEKALKDAPNVQSAALPSLGMLAANGMAPDEIARMTGMNEGEVKLMIGLAAKKGFA